jgi:hypothetical protein
MKVLLGGWLFLFTIGVSSAFALGDTVSVREAKVFGPLTVWIIDGNSTSSPHPYLTLEEALRTGRATVHENNSQCLWVENHSDTDLFLQSADLIKGGQQDRMVANDMIVPAHDTSQNLNVYCIEHGRSTKRGDEPLETFSASHWMAPLSHTRLVAMHELTEQLLTPRVGGLTAPDTNQLNLLKSLESQPQPFGYIDAAQESIWNDVSNVQTDLTKTLRDSVTRNASPTSLELSLENNSLADREHAFQNHLEDLVREDRQAVGFVYAINGHIAGAEQYGSHALFEGMWPKLLRSIGAEAMIENSDRSKETGVPTPSIEDVQQFLNASNNGKTARKKPTERTLVEASKSDAAYKFQTFDSRYLEPCLHAAWIAR